MRPTQALKSGADVPLGTHGKWLGSFGKLGLWKQKGIVSYGLAPNRQNPFAGAGHDAVFNTWRRASRQLVGWGPVVAIAYFTLEWAKARNEYLNSKAGRRELAFEEKQRELAQKK